MRRYLWIWAFLPAACASSAEPNANPSSSGGSADDSGSGTASSSSSSSSTTKDAGSAAPASDSGSPSALDAAAQPCRSGGVACDGRCVNTSVDPLNCGGCGVSCDGGTCSFGVCGSAPPPCTGSCTATVVISNAYIDNVSDLVIQGNAAHWTVLAGDAPGLHGGSNEPTTVNGTNWYPTYSSVATPYDSTNTTPVPPLPARAQTVVLGDWGNGRGGDGTVKITQQPTAPDYVLKLEFSDPPGGASHYHATITYSTQ